VPTSKGEGREGNGKRGGREEGEGRTPSWIGKVRRWQPYSRGIEGRKDWREVQGRRESEGEGRE